MSPERKLCDLNLSQISEFTTTIMDPSNSTKKSKQGLVHRFNEARPSVNYVKHVGVSRKMSMKEKSFDY